MRVIRIDPRSDAYWLRLLERYPSDVFHTPAWISAVADTYALEAAAYVLLDADGVPQAGLPFCPHGDFRGRRVLVMPFSDYCDPLVERREQWDLLVEPLLEQGCPIMLRCLHTTIPLADERFELSNRAKWHGIDLRPELDTIYHSLPEATRRTLRKAEASGVQLRIAGDAAELREFYLLHLGVRKFKYRLLAQPYSFFLNIWRRLVESGQGRLMLATHNDRIIAGTLFLEWKDTLYYKLNASAPDTLGCRPNDLLVWEGIKYAKQHGYTRFDFGLSDWEQAGLLQFKRKYASSEKTISFLKYLPRPAAPQDAQVARLFGQLTDLLTEPAVPDEIAERGGELLYPFLI